MSSAKRAISCADPSSKMYLSKMCVVKTYLWNNFGTEILGSNVSYNAEKPLTNMCALAKTPLTE